MKIEIETEKKGRNENEQMEKSILEILFANWFALEKLIIWKCFSLNSFNLCYQFDLSKASLVGNNVWGEPTPDKTGDCY